MTHKHRHDGQPLVLSDTTAPPQANEESTETWETLALLFSCGGVFIPPVRQAEGGFHTVHTPGATAYLLREDDPTSCLVMDDSLQDERRFCESVSRLLHKPTDFQSLMNERFLWSQN